MVIITHKCIKIKNYKEYMSIFSRIVLFRVVPFIMGNAEQIIQKLPMISAIQNMIKNKVI